MKILFSLALVYFTSVFSIAQIKVKTSNSSLNLRSEPTTSSNAIYSLPNETELLYANDWSEGWIKVRHSNSYNMDRSEDDEVYDYSGWVNAAFVETKMFKSTILDPMSWQDETDGCFYGIYGVNGLLGIDSYTEQSTESKFKVKMLKFFLGNGNVKLDHVFVYNNETTIWHLDIFCKDSLKNKIYQ
jgi:hypothetical protein